MVRFLRNGPLLFVRTCSYSRLLLYSHQSIKDGYVEIEVNDSKNYVKINDGRRISSLIIIKPLKIEGLKNTYKLCDNDIQNIKNAIKKYFYVENEHNI